MSLLSKSSVLLAFALAIPAFAQETALDPASSVKIELPADAPLALVATSAGDSRVSTRGGAMVLDLHMGLTLRNTGSRRVRGITLLITAQEAAPGGKGSVARPSIDVPPSQEFTVPVDIRLVRPVQQASGPLVRINLDGVLYDDLSFYGPNKLNSQRAMTVWETEAQRDRAYFRKALQARGEKGLQQEIVAALGRQAERPQVDVAMSRNGRAVAQPVGAGEHVAQFAFLQLPNAPVQLLEGSATLTGNEASAPKIDVLNRSGKPVRYVEFGWSVKDKDGREYTGGALPGSSAALSLPPGQKSRLTPETTLRFSRSGKPVEVIGMTGFVSQVEFTDGKVWVPTREELGNSPLLRIMAPSPEEQRLADVYTKKGLAALIADLNRY